MSVVNYDMLWKIVVSYEMELLTFHEEAKTLDGMIDGKKLPVKSTVLCFCRSEFLGEERDRFLCSHY